MSAAIRFFRIVLVCILMLGSVVAGQATAQQTSEEAQLSDETIWRQFLEWLPSAPPVSNPGVLFKRYRSHLSSTGVSPEEAKRTVNVLRRLHREKPDAWRVMFNNIYANSTQGFVTQPNALLMATIESRKPGHALDIGMGQGRNAVFLAMKGWDVTGFDVSDEGIAVARKNAERAGVKLNAVRETDEAFDYGVDKWDLIVFMYEPFPVTSTAYVERLGKSMKAGGIIVVESFGATAGMPGVPATAIDPEQLLGAFRNFRLLHFEDTMAMPDWGARRNRRVVRMVAEKRL